MRSIPEQIQDWYISIFYCRKCVNALEGTVKLCSYHCQQVQNLRAAADELDAKEGW